MKLPCCSIARSDDLWSALLIQLRALAREIKENAQLTRFVYGRRYWTNPAVVEKISAAMGQPVAEGAQPEGEEAVEGGEEEEEEDEEPNVHSAASTGGPEDGTGQHAMFCSICNMFFRGFPQLCTF